MAKTILHTAFFRSKTFKRESASRRYPFVVLREQSETARKNVLAECDRREKSIRAKLAELEGEVEATRERAEFCRAALEWWEERIEYEHGEHPRWIEVDNLSTGPIVAKAKKLGFMPSRIRSDRNSYNSARGIYSGADVVSTWRKELAETALGAIEIAQAKLAEVEAERKEEIEGAVGDESLTVVGWSSRRDLAMKLLSGSHGYGRFAYDTFVLVDEVEIVERTGRERKMVLARKGARSWAPKGTPTALNVFVLAEAFGEGAARGARVANRVTAVDAPHLRRCLRGGLLEVVGRELVLTDAGEEALRDYFAKKAKSP